MQHKFYQTFTILISMVTQVQCRMMPEENKSNLCASLSEIIKSFTAITTIDIIAHQHKFESLNCIETLMEQSDNHTYTINGINNKNRKKSFIIFMSDSFNDIVDLITNEIDLSNFDVSGNCLILVKHCKQFNIETLFAMLWRQHFMYNVNILTLNEIDNIVRMFTFYPFTHNNCHDTKPININEYNNDANKWMKKTIFPQKLRDFHNCPIYAAAYGYGPSAQETNFSNGTTIINGSDVDIFRGLATALNFKLQIKVLTEPGGWGQIYDNGTVTGALRLLKNGSADIAANFYYLMERRSHFFQFTRAYYSIQMLMIIPRRPQYTALRKLIRPFSLRLWLYSGIVTFSCSIAVFIIKKQSKSIQLLFLDKNINAPVLQMLVILFGSSQHVLPRNDFSRILLMSFVFFMFVLRTLYMGSLYKFLQSDGRMKDFQTIDELMDNDFYFIIDPTVEDMIKYQKFFSRRSIQNPNEYYNSITETLNPSFKGAVLSSNDEVIYLNKHNVYGKTLNVLNEVVLTVPTVFYLRKNSYLTNVINEKIDDMLAAGLINYWISKYLDEKYLRLNIQSRIRAPKYLNLQELLGAFQLLAFGLTCSIITFIVELLRSRIKRLRRN